MKSARRDADGPRARHAAAAKRYEDRAVVPEVVVSLRSPARHVGGYPRYPLGTGAHSRPGDPDRGFGEIEHGHVAVIVRQKRIDQTRSAAADIDNRRL